MKYIITKEVDVAVAAGTKKVQMQTPELCINNLK